MVGEKYQGLSVGMSIPLWENKNTVKAARAETAANMAMAGDSQLQLYAILKISTTKLSTSKKREKDIPVL